MDDIPIWLLFVFTVLLIVAAIEGGYLLGRTARRRSDAEKESPVGAIVGTVLALLAFMLAFTFSIVSDRYDGRKELVREQAAAIRDSYSRADFLPEPQRDQAKALYHDYIGIVIEAADHDNADRLPELISSAQGIQQQLWNLAVDNVRAGDNSDISALYVESINEMSNVLANRVSVAVESRIPNGIWLSLYILVLLGMAAVGYQTAIAESRRTWAMLLLALSFAVVIVLIAALDDPERGYIPVSQKPLISLQTSLASAGQP
jgi:CDP-diglyceride synthetase